MQGGYEKMTIFEQYIALSEKRLLLDGHIQRSIEFSFHPYNI